MDTKHEEAEFTVGILDDGDDATTCVDEICVGGEWLVGNAADTSLVEDRKLMPLVRGENREKGIGSI